MAQSSSQAKPSDDATKNLNAAAQNTIISSIDEVNPPFKRKMTPTASPVMKPVTAALSCHDAMNSNFELELRDSKSQ